MATRRYIAISSTSRTGNTVSDDVSFTYSATFATLTLAWADATWGFKDITGATGTDEEFFYDVFNNYTETTSGNADTAGFTLGPGNQVVVRAAPGFEHSGSAGTGVKITWDQTFTDKYHWRQYVTVQDLEFSFALSSGTGVGGFHIRDGGIAKRCIVRGGMADPGSIMLNGNGATAISCLAWNGDAAGFSLNGFFTHHLYNCASMGNAGAGVVCGSGGGAEQKIKNMLCISNTGADFNIDGSINLTATNNASEDLTAPGTSSLTSRSTAEVEDHLNGDPHLSASTTVSTAGADLSSTGTGEVADVDSKDIDGQPYTGWPIGCDQPGAFTVPFKATVYDAETLTVVQGVDVYVYDGVGAEITSGTTDANGEINTTPAFSTITNFTAQGRKGTTAPFYREGKAVGVLTGAGADVNIYMILDEE